MALMASIPALKDTHTQLKGRMEKAVEDFRKEMGATRTGRANVHMLDTIKVEYYGSPMPLNQVATVHAADAQLITIQPFDPTIPHENEKAIQTADFGMNPQNDGKMIRSPVPPLPEDRRKETAKQLHKDLQSHP